MAALNTELDGLQGQVRATRRFRNSLLGNISDIENKHLDAVLKEYYPDLIGAEALTPAQLQDLQRDWTQAKMNWIELGPELEAKLDELRDRKRDNNIRGITDVRDDKREVRQDQRNQLYQNDAQTRIEQVGFEIKDALELNINDNMTDANINAAARTLDRADNMISMLETQLRDDQFISDADYKLNYWDVVNRQRGAWVYELFQKRNALNTARDNKVRRDGDAARAKLQAEIDAKAAAILGK
jgi:hypothetical protein